MNFIELIFFWNKTEKVWNLSLKKIFINTYFQIYFIFLLSSLRSYWPSRKQWTQIFSHLSINKTKLHKFLQRNLTVFFQCVWKTSYFLFLHIQHDKFFCEYYPTYNIKSRQILHDNSKLIPKKLAKIQSTKSLILKGLIYFKLL